MPKASVDRFDDVRRAWIADHQGWSTIQMRRAWMLAKVIRARQRIVTAAVPNPHDDTTIPPLWLRATKSGPSQVESAGVAAALVIAPIGWLAGWAINRVVTRLIPTTLRSYPIAALMTTGAALGALTTLLMVLTDPGHSLTSVVVTPWICIQLASAPFIGGVYGILEGWLAVRGSDQWWPLTPPKPAIDLDTAIDILGPLDTTGPGLADVVPLPYSGERHPR